MQGGITALHIASYNNMMDTVKVLLAAKKKTEETVNIKDDVRPLLSIVFYGQNWTILFFL
jgi:ankyrin repeat protein